MFLESEYHCPTCDHVVHDYEDEYVWLPDDCYPDSRMSPMRQRAASAHRMLGPEGTIARIAAPSWAEAIFSSAYLSRIAEAQNNDIVDAAVNMAPTTSATYARV